MKDYIIKRACEMGEYLIESQVTVREAARFFNISKSTVHKDVTERLKEIDKVLYEQVKAVLEINLCERHIRGGIATKEKYKRS